MCHSQEQLEVTILLDKGFTKITFCLQNRFGTSFGFDKFFTTFAQSKTHLVKSSKSAPK